VGDLRRADLRLDAGTIVHGVELSLNRRIAMSSDEEREARMREAAEGLHFEVNKTGALFTLTRTDDVNSPVNEADLTLDEAEKLIETWKLRGLGGG
jgi:hypothetical protein